MSLSIFAGAKQLAGRFVRADRGNVAITFALTLLPIFAFVGAAVDYTRASNARTAMQAALDTTALMISKDAPGLTQDQLTTKAQGYFSALYTATSDAPTKSFTATFTPTATNGSTVQLSSSGEMKTDFMKVVGIPTIDFSLGSSAKWGNKKLRVALALDNTGSMAQDGKMPALKTAASNLIDQLSALQKNPGDVYISIVPFSRDINAGGSNYGQTWIDWTDWEAPPPDWTTALANGTPSAAIWAYYGPKGPCPFALDPNGYGCINGPKTDGTVDTSDTTKIPSNGNICPDLDNGAKNPNNINVSYNGCYNSVKVTGSDQTFTCTGSNCSCSSGQLLTNNVSNGKIGTCKCTAGVCTQNVANYTHTWVPNNHKTWNGCIADRQQSYDTLDTAPTSLNTNFPAQQFNGCPAQTPVVGLSSSWTSLKTTINSMNPTGNTNQSVGIAWAWQSLDQTPPLPAPAEDINYSYNKVVILMSDGLNTQNRWTTTASQIDAREALLCQNLKAAGITVYSIQVDTSTKDPDPLSTVMKNCASSTDKFYLLTTANDLIATFNTIGTELSQLRLAQ
jgi:Flp pilus assembly protein TadG